MVTFKFTLVRSSSLAILMRPSILDLGSNDKLAFFTLSIAPRNNNTTTLMSETDTLNDLEWSQFTKEELIELRRLFEEELIRRNTVMVTVKVGKIIIPVGEVPANMTVQDLKNK
eukprot:TRINITY_DN7036_c0_g1_i1.p2 TRINITY_DN7036_c0_g1~~TRINITY_DN7036_c0_g1_i1.p2  ORF type:complete len:114 (+),score=9.76 TRINITY_DN7036_c0_g1_i1:277-618(+)